MQVNLSLHFEFDANTKALVLKSASLRNLQKEGSLHISENTFACVCNSMHFLSFDSVGTKHQVCVILKPHSCPAGWRVLVFWVYFFNLILLIRKLRLREVK